MSVIAEKRWSHVLFDDGKGWVLTLLIGGVVEVDVSIRLTNDEIDSIKRDGSFIERLVYEVRQHRDNFSAREISPPVWPAA